MESIGGTYHHSPSCERAVRSSMKVSKEFRAGEVNGRYSRVFMFTIAFSVDLILGISVIEAVSN
jgi:hypothetical protein